MIRGDVYQANLDPTEVSEQAGKRPALKDTASHIIIVSRNGINRSSPVVVIVPLTKYSARKKIYPSHHLIKASAENGLSIDSIAKCEQIRAIVKSRLSNQLGKVNIQDREKIDRALKIVLSLN